MSSRPLPSSSSGAAPDALEEVQFRARMARLGTEPENRRGRRRPPRALGRGGFRLGWKGWLVVDSLIVLLVVAGVVAWPPIQACRHQDKTTGFYAGDSVDRCIRRGIAERIDRADQRLKALARNSGR
ncbi:hypothetical protein [Methylobacterium pseudosasicola]|uniref:Uncharacterized protein n=1 Tax=Methylobacterium pseudosasicola TaxID=582667 RepID=A0A1I4N222_9HYPH|nr:hypothetical protein [Methylobacterium pseudosasicola]SFM09528.1 hypothetical protein SAMN05192568_101933 [Methylobacterium pseudosasicola]